MAIRVKHRVWIHAFGDTEEKLTRFAPDPEKQEIITDEQQKQFNGDISVPPTTGTPIEQLSLGDIEAVKGLYLELDAAAKVRLNGSIDSLDVIPLKGASTAKAKLFIEANITQIEVENEDGTNPLTGVYCIWGDPTP
jgi:hypothetical protein